MTVRRIPDIRAKGEVAGWFVAASDVTEKRRTEEQRLADERRLRDALVAEVHHRVKNILQIVAGLMRAQMAKEPDLAPALEPILSKVLAASVGFGLMGSNYHPGVTPCEMVRQICTNLEQMTGAKIETFFDGSIARESVRVDGAQAVNTALVINELLFNAIKHGGQTAGKVPVTVRLSRDLERGIVTIRNRGTLPSGFDFGSGTGLGTGLSLVRLLLQPSASQLSFERTPTDVIATLQVRSTPPKTSTATTAIER